jgi:crotonobetainyl-CoA:carnitine CoA-transferase CaiB-like acyl-CoA transferase
MQNVLFRLSDTPGEIRHPGVPQGHDTDEVLRELGKSDEEITQLRESGVV